MDYPVYDAARDVFVSGRSFDRYKRAVKFEFVTNEGRLRVVERERLGVEDRRVVAR